MWDLRLRRPIWDIQAQAGPICFLYSLCVRDDGHGEVHRGAKIATGADACPMPPLPPLTKFEVPPGNEIIMYSNLCGSPTVSKAWATRDFSLVALFDEFATGAGLSGGVGGNE